MESVFWLLIGIYVTVSAYHMGLGRLRQPGPGFIFFLAALLLIILAIIDLGITSVKKSDKNKNEELVWLGVRWQKVLLMLAGLSIYAYVLEPLGFLASTFLLMIFMFESVEPMKWWKSILGSLITVSASYALFKVWLKVPFPTGVFGF